MRRSLGIDLGLLGVLERGHAVERRERGLAPRVRVERRDPDQPVHAALAREQAVRVATLHDERRGRDAGLLAFLDLVDLEVEAAPLRPAREHAEQHLGPVLRVGTARAGVDLADRVALVVLAAEQRAQLELIELLRSLGDAFGDLTLDGVVALFAASSYSVSASVTRCSSASTTSTSARTRDSSVVTLRAWSGSFHRSASPASVSSSASRFRASSIRR